MAVVFFSTQIVIIMYLIQRSCRIRCKGEFKKGYSLNKIEHNNNNNNNSNTMTANFTVKANGTC